MFGIVKIILTTLLKHIDTRFHKYRYIYIYRYKHDSAWFVVRNVVMRSFALVIFLFFLFEIKASATEIISLLLWRMLLSVWTRVCMGSKDLSIKSRVVTHPGTSNVARCVHSECIILDWMQILSHAEYSNLIYLIF